MKEFNKGEDGVVIYRHYPSNESGQIYIGEVKVKTSSDTVASFSTYWDEKGNNKGRHDSRFNLTPEEMESAIYSVEDIISPEMEIDIEEVVNSLDLEAIEELIEGAKEGCSAAYLVSNSDMGWELHLEEEPDTIYVGPSFKDELDIQYWIPKGEVIILQKELFPNTNGDSSWYNYKIKITLEEEEDE